MQISDKTMIKELVSLLEGKMRAFKTPTPKYLRENVEVLAEMAGCILYANGYAVYDNGDAHTVIWVPSCINFKFHFLDEIKPIEKEKFEVLPWYYVVVLVGEHRIEENSMNNRQGGRLGTKDFKTDDAGDHAGDAEEAYESSYRNAYIWREPYIGENPESIVIHREMRRELLSLMTLKQRFVFIRYYRDGLNQREISEELGISRSAVRDRLDGALKKVKPIYM